MIPTSTNTDTPLSISCFDKLSIWFKALTCLGRLPKKIRPGALVGPIDSTRYTEFAYILKYFSQQNIRTRGWNILDASSPYMLSYILSRDATVIKTDINPAEGAYIAQSNQLTFKLEDATRFTFADNTFDFVYSISVVEHIYQKTAAAINEMIRVCKPGGYVYITFPVSKTYTEEWLESSIYSHQHNENNKTFFQYRFDEQKTNEILGNLSGVETVSKAIFWERSNGAYNRMTTLMRRKLKNKYLETLRMGALNVFYGFYLLKNKPEDFSAASSLGNISIILKKV